jgi:hypothetical protein
MTEEKRQKILLIAFVVCLIGTVTYFATQKRSTGSAQQVAMGPTMNMGASTDTSAMATTPSVQEGVVDEQVIKAVLQMREIRSLDVELFASPLYLRLKDKSKAIFEETVGRPNPFAPVDEAVINRNPNLLNRSQAPVVAPTPAPTPAPTTRPAGGSANPFTPNF